MEDWRLEVTVVSAEDLKDVNFFCKMDVYVVVSINGDSRSMHITPVHKNGGTSPSWNSTMRFSTNDAAAQLNRLTLSFKLRCKRVLGDKDIGQVLVPVNDLLRQAGGSNGIVSVTLPVKRPSGRHQGDLTISYMFGDQAASPWAPEPQAPDLPNTPVLPVPSTPPVANPPPPPPPPPPYTYTPAPWYTPETQPPRRRYRLQPFVQAMHLALEAAGLFCGPSAGAGCYDDDDFCLGLLGL